ncbi:hypothetical protein HS088_TW03G00065 [Tripterygium wilfordii]|uniref:K-box domain-containing protein n=1 Tax=Tripterygium wilfordii TaxID=458696 RepID=A0A7J7DTQ7_TRIWF|nr:hypothetical protein HS088_TW03G00065 [Tripterygium wilfordii]
MKEILERHHLHSKNLEKMEQPSLELQLVENSNMSRLSKEVAEKSHLLRIEDLQQLEKSLETGLRRVIERKGEKIMKEITDLQRKGMLLMEENERLRQQVVEISTSRKRQQRFTTESDDQNVVYEEGLSSESVTDASNNSGGPPPHDIESSDTSLKLGLPY